MRLLSLFAALAPALILVAAPFSVAHADGIERPRVHHHPRPHRRPPPPIPAPRAPERRVESETVTLSQAFFVGGGGVGADIGTGYVGGGTTVI